MADIEELIERLREALAGVGTLPLCPDWMYTSIRHCQRNEDFEASDGFNEPDRYGGSPIAHIINAMPQVLTALSAQQREIAELREAMTALNGHVEVMQRMCERWLVPEAYEDRAGVVWSDGDPTPFADDMVYMLDGPEQREAQGKARAALNTPSQEGEKR